MSARRHGALAVLAALTCLLLPAVAPATPARPGAQGGQEPPARRSQQPGPRVQARAWGVVDGRTGDVLVSHAGNEELPIASTTKLMTAYVALRDLPLEKMVRAQPYEAEYGESLMGLRAGQRISVRDLLYGLILRSGNDAAHTLAIAAAGSEERFVAQMNRYAAALGLSHSHYANPVGLDDKENYSSAFDLMTLTQRLLREPAFAKIADSRSAVLRSVHPRRRIETINELLGMAPWVTGVKTGHTFGALYVLVGSGRRRGVSLISVVVGAPTDEDRFADNLELLEWGFSQYRRRLPIRIGQDLADPEIRYSGGRLPLRAERAVAVGIRRGQRLDLTVRAPQEVEGPIRRGAKLGRASVFVDGRLAGAVSLRAGRAVPEASSFDRARAFVGDNLVPIGLAACVILMVAVALLPRLARKRARS
ncbi:MAG TPA: D-alanyl-D-alanine carboxypeptidase family protein [Solirubrobacterales bacterium]|jgi:D-alanyl-D-alanine carboxypeptidase (penicillin-binding protein 5/6)|nr:D-alanyl-D-alanine carboxypeptidase family protein [Solirubrobacterales bacterium]